MKQPLTPSISTPRAPKHVLFIAAAFPPIGGPGVQRTAKFAKYLPKFGWHPLVWTMDRMDGLPEDTSLLADLPPEVLRLTPGARQATGAATLHRAFASLTGGAMFGLPSLAGFLWRGAAATSPYLIDDHGAWTAASLGPLMQWIRARNIRAIYSTFSPPANHWLALSLKERTGLPWVADFRDLWTDDCRYAEPAPARAQAHRRLQQSILETADRVIGVSPSQTAILARHVPDQAEKFTTITNGFDPDDFRDLQPSQPNSAPRFVLAHVGRFDRHRASEALIEGVRRFVRELGPVRSRFELRLVGHAAQETLDRLEMAGIPYSFERYVAHRQAIQEMASATALLLPLPTGPQSESIIAGKLFEYLASRRPILVVGPKDGECEAMVRRLDAGAAIGHDAAAVAETLTCWFSAWRGGKQLMGSELTSLGAMNRVEQTRTLASVLDNITQGGERPTRNARIPGPHRKVSPSLRMRPVVSRTRSVSA